jgi:hypothetical protein
MSLISGYAFYVHVGSITSQRSGTAYRISGSSVYGLGGLPASPFPVPYGLVKGTKENMTRIKEDEMLNSLSVHGLKILTMTAHIKVIVQHGQY